MTTKQTFTVQTARANPSFELGDMFANVRLHSSREEAHGRFKEAGRSDYGDGTTISWTAPEPIIEVPTGIGAVVVAQDGRGWVKVREETDTQYPWQPISRNDVWEGDTAMADLLRAGAEIKSHGVEL